MMFDPDDMPAAANECESLLTRARQLYPLDAYLQNEWLRAVMTVRMTNRGWLLDGVVRPQGVAA